jgi:hypothetical protein
VSYLLGLAMLNPRLAIGISFLSVFLVVCILAAKLRTLKLTAIFSILGYIGAGLYYLYFLGLDSQTRLSCPLCTDIDGRGGPLRKFVSYTLISGTINAICAIASGWLIVGLLRSARRWRNAVHLPPRSEGGAK